MCDWFIQILSVLYFLKYLNTDCLIFCNYPDERCKPKPVGQLIKRFPSDSSVAGVFTSHECFCFFNLSKLYAVQSLHPEKEQFREIIESQELQSREEG